MADHPFVEAVLAQVGQQLFASKGAISRLLLTRVADQHFVHGGFTMGGRIGGMFYFEDAEVGLIAVADIPPGIEAKYALLQTPAAQEGRAVAELTALDDFKFELLDFLRALSIFSGIPAKWPSAIQEQFVTIAPVACAATILPAPPPFLSEGPIVPVTIVVETAIAETPRVLQVRGLFDLPAAKTSCLEWTRRPAAGRKAVARRPDRRPLRLRQEHHRPPSLRRRPRRTRRPGRLAGLTARSSTPFPTAMPLKEVAALLSAVGFSVAAGLAAALSRALHRPAVPRAAWPGCWPRVPTWPSWTSSPSVVDRTVAQVGSAALARTVRRRSQQLRGRHLS